jgi:sulfur carrier protein
MRHHGQLAAWAPISALEPAGLAAQISCMASDIGGPKSVVVNGEPTETGARTLAALVASLGFAQNQVATALNGDFVPRGRRDATLLGTGDRVEIVAPRQGG